MAEDFIPENTCEQRIKFIKCSSFDEDQPSETVIESLNLKDNKIQEDYVTFNPQEITQHEPPKSNVLRMIDKENQKYQDKKFRKKL